MTAYDAGFDAYRAGKPESENPYCPMGQETEFLEWGDGWKDASESPEMT
jgi:ribosome modulation factor